MPTLVDRLREIQRVMGWSDADMARKIGCSKSAYTNGKAGSLRWGNKVLGGIARTFPQLRNEVLAYMTGADETRAVA